MGFFGGKSSSSNSGTKKVPNSRKKKEAQQTTIKKKENINTKKSSTTTKSSSNNNTSIQTSVPTATSSSISPSAPTPTVNAHERRINAKNTSMPQTIDLDVGFETGQSSKSEEALFTFTFHVESLRLFAHLGLLLVFVQGALITQYSGLNSIPDEEATEIFRIFSFNHTCNWIDHNPARMIAAILIPLYTVLTLGYIIFTHLRLARSVKKGEVPCWLLQTSRILSPFNFLAVALLHLWFVNNPDGEYGFIAHYIPYLLFQVALTFMGMMNVQYLIYKNELPWGLKPSMGWAYQGIFVALTLISIMGVITILAGTPMLDTKNSASERAAFRAISSIYGIMILIFPIALSARERRNGDSMTLNA